MSDVSRNRVEAIVRDNRDPDRHGRVKIECEAIGEKGQVLSQWVDPEFSFAGAERGFFFVPAVGEIVIVEYVTSSAGEQIRGETSMTTPRYRWIAQTYGRAAPPGVLATNYGKRVGFADPTGGAFVLDEQESKAYVLGAKVLLGAESGTLPVARKDDPVTSTPTEDGVFWTWLSGFANVITTTWIVVPNDGGAALKTAMGVFVAANPVPASLASKIVAGSAIVEAA